MCGRLSIPGCVFGLAVAVSALGSDGSPAPGTVNYFEGLVSLDGNAVKPDSAGTVAVLAGQSLRTEKDSRAEVLLAPGVSLRLGESTEVRFLAAAEHDIRIEVTSGEAVIDADRIGKRDQIDALMGKADVAVESRGVYEFRASAPELLVFSGKEQAADQSRRISLRGREELRLDGSAAKTDRISIADQDALYSWDQMRDEYVSDATEWTADAVAGGDDAATQAAGWCWSPWYRTWTFIPAFDGTGRGEEPESK